MTLPAVNDPRVPWFARMKRTRLEVPDPPALWLRTPTRDRLPVAGRRRELTEVERAVVLLHRIIQRDPPDVCEQRRRQLLEALDGSTEDDSARGEVPGPHPYAPARGMHGMAGHRQRSRPAGGPSGVGAGAAG